MKWRYTLLGFGFLLLVFFIVNVEAPAETVNVTVSAYNTVKGQTSGNPNRGSCGIIKPGSNVIAVSRDLKRKYPCGTKVKLNGKTYKVWDTMGKRWRNKIDVCYHKDITAARRHGVKKNVKMEIM